MKVFSGRRRQGLRPARAELLAGPALQPRRCSPRPASTRTARRRPGPTCATAAKKITALGDGTVGYGDYSKSNTGGWHFTAELYSLGGDVAVKDGDTWKAAFNNAKGKQVLQQLKDMRWTDNTMGQQQLLEWADLLQMMASGKLGMYVAHRRTTSRRSSTSTRASTTTTASAPIPGGKGTLGGGEGYMFKARPDARRRSRPA